MVRARSEGSFSQVLRQQRLRCGLTQLQLAALSTISVRAIRDMESGRVASPRRATVALLAGALRLTGQARTAFCRAAQVESSYLDKMVTESMRSDASVWTTDGLVGREHELDAITGLLAAEPRQRLLTITGISGVGKTRLALEVGQRVLAELDIPLLWVPVAEAHHDWIPNAATPPLLEAMVELITGQADTSGELAAIIGTTPMIVFLDGLDDVPVHARALLRLLADCPHVTVVTTARVPLGIRGECVLPLAPLAVPEPGQERDLDSLIQVPAVSLLLRQLAPVQPDFRLNPANASMIAGLCRMLDGLPAALGLAASQCLMEPLPHLYGQLVDDPRNLHALICHHPEPMLYAAVMSSVETLPQPHRRLLDRLLQIDGCWTVDEAAGATGLSRPELTRSLHVLFIRGLLRRVERHGDYLISMLNIVRHACAEIHDVPLSRADQAHLFAIM
ncbi:helix-turn-helix domain-containing protein [Nonomuraea sp. ZG12]|uniref:helix-turn-helix domain-containing protein n=1 Tax=Nonomuraea sp. ZG12 TaxID=3452207 RepID=UPI003F8A31F2